MTNQRTNAQLSVLVHFCGKVSPRKVAFSPVAQVENYVSGVNSYHNNNITNLHLHKKLLKTLHRKCVCLE